MRKSLILSAALLAAPSALYANTIHKSGNVTLNLAIKNASVQKQSVIYQCSAQNDVIEDAEQDVNAVLSGDVSDLKESKTNNADKLAKLLPSRPFTVRYVNVGDNSLAIVPFLSGDRILVDTISADGGRYVGGIYTWWEKGGEATLSSALDENATLTCREQK